MQFACGSFDPGLGRQTQETLALPESGLVCISTLPFWLLLSLSYIFVCCLEVNTESCCPKDLKIHGLQLSSNFVILISVYLFLASFRCIM